ncbi:MAG TPA: RNA polymerase subunit sigma-70 [Streptosporangiaceae bacterium]
MTTDLLTRARAGDQEAFRQLVEPYRLHLQLHCYRVLGSVHDAEDALQETLLSAWLGLGGFEERASVRTWLYRIATNCCLKAQRSRRRRQSAGSSASWPDLPEPTRLGQVLWLEPYPDLFLDQLKDTSPGPAARFEAREAVSLAFVTALQLLPPRQRAVLILRDVLGFRAREVAQVLDSTEESVTSALKRARATLQRELPTSQEREQPPAPGSAAERKLVERFTAVFEAKDVHGIVGLLTEDVWLTMPPVPLEWQGRDLADRFLTATATWHAPPRLVATRANGQPAFGLYVRDPQAPVAHAIGLLVLTLAGDRIGAMTRFDTSMLAFMGLPRTLPDASLWPRGPTPGRGWPGPGGSRGTSS